MGPSLKRHFFARQVNGKASIVARISDIEGTYYQKEREECYCFHGI